MSSLRSFLVWAIPLAITIGLIREAAIDTDTSLSSPFRIARLLSQRPDSSVAMPVVGAHIRGVANTWNAPRVGHRHQGQDIFARRGTPVLSGTDGVVVRLSQAGIGGNAVSVLGAGGRIYYYAHLLRFAPGIAPGSPVNLDTLLGYVGNTGNARTTPPHLHFGIYGPNGAINPLPLLADRHDPQLARASAPN